MGDDETLLVDESSEVERTVEVARFECFEEEEREEEETAFSKCGSSVSTESSVIWSEEREKPTKVDNVGITLQYLLNQVTKQITRIHLLSEDDIKGSSLEDIKLALLESRHTRHSYEKIMNLQSELEYLLIDDELHNKLTAIEAYEVILKIEEVEKFGQKYQETNRNLRTIYNRHRTAEIWDNNSEDKTAMPIFSGGGITLSHLNYYEFITAIED